jgi:hypothetical protein
MKNYRFYLEYETPSDKRTGTVKRPGKHSGNVCAAELSTLYFNGTGASYEGFSSVFNHADSAVNWGGLPTAYLASNCRRIPESLARQIHPQLFARLDAAE